MFLLLKKEAYFWFSNWTKVVKNCPKKCTIKKGQPISQIFHNFCNFHMLKSQATKKKHSPMDNRQWSRGIKLNLVWKKCKGLWEKNWLFYRKNRIGACTFFFNYQELKMYAPLWGVWFNVVFKSVITPLIIYY